MMFDSSLRDDLAAGFGASRVMHIIRFLADDGRVLLGEEHGDGTATVLLDARGVLVENQQRLAVREMLKGKRALIADDDDGIRQLVSATLERMQCKCTVCKDGGEAIDALRSISSNGGGTIDFVVSDIVMPHHDGYEIFAAAKSRRGDMPVVLITGFGYDPGHKLVRATKEGLEGVLFKPFTPQQLIDKLTDAVQEADDRPCCALVRTSERLKICSARSPLLTRDIFCAGRNYRPDIGKSDLPPLELFMKPRSSAQDPRKPIRLPHDVEGPIICEGELAVVIGEKTKSVSVDDALDHVLGYTIANDVTANNWQTNDADQSPMQWMRGKGFDTFCPIGPRIVTTDELNDPSNLAITMSVNDEVVSEGNTRDMNRSVAELVSEVSQNITLHPGSVLLTGAPPVSSGASAELRAGDVVSIEIEGVGVLQNPVQ